MSALAHEIISDEEPQAAADEPRQRRWSYEEYERLGDAGVLPLGERMELLAGVVLEMSPQQSRHATAVSLAHEALRAALRPGFHVRVQFPFRVGADSAPEPDLAVVAGAIRDYTGGHPTQAALVLEVSDTTLAYDRGVKASLYASAGVPEYWIVDLVAQRVEVRRGPQAMPGQPFGHSYRSVTVYSASERVALLVVPAAPIAVADLLP